MSKSQTNPSASQVTTHNRFAIQDTTEDPMDITEAVNRQHTQRTPPPSPIFIDDVIDIHTDSKHEYKTPDNKRKLNNTGS